MNTQKILGLVMFVILAMLPFGSAAPDATFEQKVDTAITHGQAVIDLQTQIQAQFPIAGGRSAINDNLFNAYRLGLDVYENDIGSIPEVFFTQNGQLVEKVTLLQTVAKSIENTNIALQARTSVAQAKILAFEDPAILTARKYVDSLVAVMQFKLTTQVTAATGVNQVLILAQDVLATQANTPITQAEYDAQNAAFEAEKTSLVNQMTSLQNVYGDLMRQAIALNNPANKETINNQNIALKILKEQTANLHLTIANVPPPAPVDTDADGVTDASDNCPAIVNVDQANMDQDAMGDLCDADKDGDGIANDIDNCPVNANADQANADGDSLGNVCDANNGVTPTEYETRYSELRTKYNNYNNDYDEFERKYSRAQDKDATSDIRKYKVKLEKLQDDLDNLEDDLNRLQNEVEDNANDNNLEDNINDLIDDVQTLNDNIDETLGKGRQQQVVNDNNQEFVAQTSRTQTSVPENEVQQVEVQTFSGLPVIQDETANTSSWESMRVYAWLGVGALLIVAVLVLLIAAIVRK